MDCDQLFNLDLSPTLGPQVSEPPSGTFSDITTIGGEDQANAIVTFALSQDQQDSLQLFARRWMRRSVPPSEHEFKSLASLEGLTADFVRNYYHHHLLSAEPAAYQPRDLLSPITGSSLNGEAPSLVRTLSTSSEIARYTRASRPVLEVRQWSRQRFAQPCSSHQARGAPSNLLYKCTSPGCTYSTLERDAWQRHEQNWQPQEFWNCVLCRAESRPSTIIHRKDKVFEHFHSAHPQIERERYDTLRQSSEIAFAAGFELQCKFVGSDGVRCPKVFQTWEERVQHYLAHFNDRVAHGPWTLHRGRHRWFDDEDDGSNGGTGGSGSGGPSPTDQGPRQRRRTSYHQSTRTQRGNRQQQGQTRQNGVNAAVLSTLSHPSALTMCPDAPETDDTPQLGPSMPSSLLDVDRCCIVEASKDARYLAFDHTHRCGSVYSVPTLLSAMPDPSHVRMECLPAAFKDAVTLTRDLGHRYLWIAELCEREGTKMPSRSILEHAELTIVRVPAKPSNCDQNDEDAIQCYQFACPYRRVDEVFALGEENGPFLHVRNLGHGSYGIVDEVKPRYGGPSFARKELLVSRFPPKIRALTLGEINILQRLDHPHVPRFVAAYYRKDRRSWNILMTPVAHINLREYLNEPGRWPENRAHSIRWFMCLASAVEYLHSVGCRHRDIKPANILINGHDVLLSDFGTSYDFAVEESSSSGDGFMTPKYCAPEVAAKRKRGRKADVFSLGCVFAEMLTVELGSSLERMSAFFRVAAPSHGRYATYHSHLASLHRWLDVLNERARSPYHVRLLRLCKAMTSFTPSWRPSATAILRDLSGDLNSNTAPPHLRCVCSLRWIGSQLDKLRLTMRMANNMNDGAMSLRSQACMSAPFVSQAHATTIVVGVSLPGLHDTTYLQLKWRWPGLKSSKATALLHHWLYTGARATACEPRSAADTRLRVDAIPDDTASFCRERYRAVMTALAQIFTKPQTQDQATEGRFNRAVAVAQSVIARTIASVSASVEAKQFFSLAMWIAACSVGLPLPSPIGFSTLSLAANMIQSFPSVRRESVAVATATCLCACSCQGQTQEGDRVIELEGDEDDDTEEYYELDDADNEDLNDSSDLRATEAKIRDDSGSSALAVEYGTDGFHYDHGHNDNIPHPFNLHDLSPDSAAHGSDLDLDLNLDIGDMGTVTLKSLRSLLLRKQRPCECLCTQHSDPGSNTPAAIKSEVSGSIARLLSHDSFMTGSWSDSEDPPPAYSLTVHTAAPHECPETTTTTLMTVKTTGATAEVKVHVPFSDLQALGAFHGYDIW